MNLVEEALKHTTDTKDCLIGAGVAARTGEMFRNLFPGEKAVVVADANTWRVAGETVERSLAEAGVRTEKAFVFTNPELFAEWSYVIQLEEGLRGVPAVPVAVGSGVINDLCKLSAAHLGQSYLSVATAASVDGYTSFGASISYKGLKQTFDCPAPVALLADVDVLANAPKVMTAAGYADLAAKIPCGAEWMIADLFGTEPIIPEAWHMLQDVLVEQLSDPEGVAAGKPESIEALFEGLTLSGFAMQAARSSRPASCTDHLFSHYLDMTHHTFQGELQSHGFQVAIGTLTMCAFFDAFLQMDLSTLDVEHCVAQWPTLEQEQERARQLFSQFIDPELGYREITRKYSDAGEVRKQLTLVRDNWTDLRDRCRRQVFPFAKMQQLFKAVGAPADPADIGVARQQLLSMVPFTQLMRWRINLLDLAKRACIYDELVAKVFGKGGAWEVG